MLQNVLKVEKNPSAYQAVMKTDSERYEDEVSQKAISRMRRWNNALLSITIVSRFNLWRAL